MRHVQDLTRFCSKPSANGTCDRLASLGDAGHESPRAQLDVLESVARRLFDPLQFFRGGRGEPALSNAAADSPFAQIEVHIYDVRFACGQCQHATTPTANEDRWMRLLNQNRRGHSIGESVVPAVERYAVAGGKTLEDLQGGFQSFHALTRA